MSKLPDPKINIQTKNGKQQKKKLASLPKSSVTNKLVQHQTMKNPGNDYEEALYWRSPSVESTITPNRSTFRELWRRALPFLVSILGAILVGLVLGFSVLSIFSDKFKYSDRTIDSHLYLPPKKEQSIIKNQSSSHELSTIYLLQAGHYRNQQGAIQKARKLHIKGLSAVISSRTPYRVYVSVTNNEQKAREYVKLFQSKGIQVYPVNWHLANEKPSVPPSVQISLRKSNQIWNQLVNLQTNQSFSDKKSLKNSFFDLESSIQDQTRSLTMIQKEPLVEMLESLRDVLFKDGSVAQMQEELIRYIIAYKQFLSTT
ncbi:hypothetical protein SAMN05444392_101639 [Seinonella peptonophila]|uniref:SPOR domain-containing protein n=1 Tax=Seinonella peptonophila TaxID=112248 RepID=A0A1M4TTR3_9BACL|nr:SPOR domain-containing protein [Seinonella peptonophila]SHE47880.1 hypothetical protein SAMN05444392_101639 [Seinonella peptonophila]